MKKNQFVYLDYASTTPLHPLAKTAMEPFLMSNYGNPSSLHQLGVKARKAVDESRITIAKILNAKVGEIIFTSGGTESCNLAILGLLKNTKSGSKQGHIITTKIEHHAVLEPIRELEKQGFQVTYLPVDKEGFVSVGDVKTAIKKNTVLVSVMYANNEIGTIQPIAEIGRLIKQVNTGRVKKGFSQILFHTDACQGVGSLDVNVQSLGVDLLSASASKFYGPKGNGFLFVRKGVLLHPLVYGGGQERGLRSGTENVAGIVGMVTALELAVQNQALENKRLIPLQDFLIKNINKIFPKVILNGPDTEKDKVLSIKYKAIQNRLPNNINLTFPGVDGEALMLYLDAKGFCVSTGSACSTGSPDASHVLLAIGRSEKQAKSSIRVSLGKSTTEQDLVKFIKVIKEVILLILDEQ